jgi:hypothetical protein
MAAAAAIYLSVFGCFYYFLRFMNRVVPTVATITIPIPMGMAGVIPTAFSLITNSAGAVS